MRSAHLLRGFLVVALLCSVGCSSNNKGKIEGTKWSSTASNVTDKKSGQTVSLPAGALSLDFGSDKKLVYKAGPQTFTGTYSLGWGDNVTLNLDQELAGRKNHVEKVSINGDTLTMTDSDGTALTFKKVN